MGETLSPAKNGGGTPRPDAPSGDILIMISRESPVLSTRCSRPLLGFIRENALKSNTKKARSRCSCKLFPCGSRPILIQKGHGSEE